MAEDTPKECQYDVELILKTTDKKTGKVITVTLSKDPFEIMGGIFTPFIIKSMLNNICKSVKRQEELKKEIKKKME